MDNGDGQSTNEGGPDDLYRLRASLAALGDALNSVSAGVIDSLVLPADGVGRFFALSTADLPYRMAVESMGEGAATVAADGSIVWANARLREMVGADIVGSAAVNLAVPRDRSLLAATLEERDHPDRRVMVDLLGCGSQPVPVQATAASFDFEGVTLDCLIVADLTEARRAADESLLSAERRFRDLFAYAPIGLARLCDDGAVCEANPAFAGLVGLPERELIGARVEDLGLAVPAAGAVTEGVLAAADGRLVPVELTASRLPAGTGEASSIILSARDLTAQRGAEAAAAESESHYRGLFQSLHEGVVRHDAQGRLVEANDAAIRILGLRQDELLGVQPDGTPLLLLRSDGSAFAAEDLPASVALRTRVPVLGVLIGVERSPAPASWILVNAEPVFSTSGSHFAGVVVSFADVTSLRTVEGELRAANAQLAHSAGHDSLTGLANRGLLMEAAERAMAVGQKSGRPTGLLLVDVDNFKDINDTLGHLSGDRVLCIVGERLTSAVREEDLVCRLGGDEFAVLVRDVTSTDVVGILAQRMVEACREAVDVDDFSLSATISVGVAVTSDSRGPGTASDLLRDADIALYSAKEQGRNRVHHYTADMGAQVDSLVAVEREVRGALERGELEVWYQPEISLLDRSIIAVEALVRWRRRDGTVLVAGQFVHALERLGLMNELDAWVLQRACADAFAWSSDPLLGRLKVRVNFGAHQLADTDMLEMVDAVLRTTGMSTCDLCIEVTETVALSRSATVAANLKGLRDRGIELAIDDFGTGYGSLSYLHQYAFDTIKIDRSFVSAISTEPRTRDLVAGLIALAERLSVSVTAEGVESEADAQMLRSMGCPTAQGFLFSPALPVAALSEFRLTGVTGKV